jgi:hypothetical protein
MHEKSLQCASNWFRSMYQALEHSTTHTPYRNLRCSVSKIRFNSASARDEALSALQVTAERSNTKHVPKRRCAPVSVTITATVCPHTAASLTWERGCDETHSFADFNVSACSSRLAALLQKRDLTYGFASLSPCLVWRRLLLRRLLWRPLP